MSPKRVSSGRTRKSLDLRLVGHGVPRVDARGKVTGRAKYVADLKTQDMLVGKMLFSQHPHALIEDIDISPARKLAGVHAVLTAGDIPGENQIGVVVDDQPLLVAERVRWIGECLALVAAETEEEATVALSSIRVKYRILPPLAAVEEAQADPAPKLHPGGNLRIHLKIRKGDIERGFQESDIVLAETFHTQRQEHVYLETNGVLAIPGGDGSVTILGSIQCPFYVQKGVARVLGLALSKVRVIQATTGGGFGGKEDVPTEISAGAALLAQKVDRPVHLILSREEDFRRSSKRHPMSITYRLGATGQGKMRAAQIEVAADMGAYATLSPVVLYRSTVHATGPYDIPNVQVDTYGYYTNNPPSGAFRGFGTPEVTFAHESMMDRLAERLNMDPIEIRLLNGFQPGSVTATGQVLRESVGHRETLMKAREAADWDHKRAAGQTIGPGRRRGVGVATMFYGVSLGAKGWSLDGAAAWAQVHQDGSVSVAIGCTEMGQGAQTVISQMAAEALGLPLGRVTVLPTDTGLVPDSGPTVASRTTVFCGNAVLKALDQIKDNMRTVAGELLSVSPQEVSFRDGQASAGASRISFDHLAGECFRRNINLGAEGWFVSPPCSFDEQTGQGDAYYVYGYGTQVAEVEVDTETGKVRVIQVTAAHDIGRAIHPPSARGQIEGGVVQGVGYALLEDFAMAGGQIMTPDLATYTIPTVGDVPQVKAVIVEAASAVGPFGAKGLGEQPIIPTAAAVANAIAHATGVRMTRLPITPEALRRALCSEQGRT